MHESSGILKYFQNYCIVYIDPQIYHYYYSLIPKVKYVQQQMHRPHITVVRKDKETVQNWKMWRKYEDCKIFFVYDNYIYNSDKYYWLAVHSKQIGDIRVELGLPRFRNNFLSYHITLGNTKK